MRRIAILCFFVLSLAQVASSQKLANIAGKWDVTIRMRAPSRLVNEQWTIQQKGQEFTGMVKATSGEHPLTFEVNDVRMRAMFKVGDMYHKVIATVDGDVMDGSLTIEAPSGQKDEYIWSAKRNKS